MQPSNSTLLQFSQDLPHKVPSQCHPYLSQVRLSCEMPLYWACQGHSVIDCVIIQILVIGRMESDQRLLCGSLYVSLFIISFCVNVNTSSIQNEKQTFFIVIVIYTFLQYWLIFSDIYYALFFQYVFPLCIPMQWK